MHVPQQLVFPQEGDTAAALPAPETLPFPGAPVRRTSSGLRGEKNISDHHRAGYELRHQEERFYYDVDTQRCEYCVTVRQTKP